MSRYEANTVCDRCSRKTESYIISLGMKICGICVFEIKEGEKDSKQKNIISCPYCGEEWDINKACQCGATVKNKLKPNKKK